MITDNKFEIFVGIDVSKALSMDLLSISGESLCSLSREIFERCHAGNMGIIRYPTGDIQAAEDLTCATSTDQGL